MKKLNTPFGTLYIDEWGDRANRPERDRITIYDSRKEYLDYFSLDYFYQGVDEEERGEITYNKLCNMLECGAEEKTLWDFLDWLGILFYYAGTDKEKAAWELSNGHPEELLPNELETNEYVNHIGDNYVVVSDC